MKLFLDTANLEEIQEGYSLGIIDGITTNPSLIKKAVETLKEKTKKVDVTNYIENILKIARGTPVSLEVTKRSSKEMIEEGKVLFKKFNPVARNVMIKIPINTSFKEEGNLEGLKAIKALSQANIPVNCTLIFTPEQGLLAAKAGAKIIRPFAGRIDDFLREKNLIRFEKEEYYPSNGRKEGERVLQDNGIVSGVHLVRECVEIVKNYNLKTEVLAASVRNPRQLRELALVGAHATTAPLGVIKNALAHAKTTEGIKKFTLDIPKEYEELGERNGK